MRSHEMPRRWQIIASPLPEYSEWSVCAKCGHTSVGTMHRDEGCSDNSCTTCPAEVLVRTCRRCQYQWCEAPIAATSPTVAATVTDPTVEHPPAPVGSVATNCEEGR